MASTNATYYRGGTEQTSSDYVGTIGFDGFPVVGRFRFTTPSSGAASFSFSTAYMRPTGQTTESSGDPGAFRWRISEDANAYKGGASGGNAVAYRNGKLMSNGAASVQLMPNRTFYLWIYPSNTSYNRYAIGSVTVQFIGAYGEASTVTCTNPATFGAANTITLSRNLDSALHTVKVTCLGQTEMLLENSATYPTITWTPAVATYAPLLTTGLTTTATITVETFYNGYSVGSRSTTVTVQLDAVDVQPVITMAVSDPTGYATTYGAYVESKSKIRVELTPTYRYGATGASVSISANGAAYSVNPAVTDEIASTSNTDVLGRITDSRGVPSNVAQQTLTILAYSAPQIVSFVLHRCLQDGTLDDQGAYMRIDYDVAVTALNNHNAKNLSVQYKKRSDQNYTTQAVSMTTYSQTGNIVIAADTNSTYDVQLVLADDFTTVTIEVQLSTAFATMNFKRGGDGIAIGKVAEYSKTLELAAGWTIRRDGVDELQKLDDLATAVPRDYALKTEIPDVSDFATAADLQEYTKIADLPVISYVDDAAARSDITLTSNGYYHLTLPTLPTGAVLISIAIIAWTSNTGAFYPSVYGANGDDAYLIGTPNTVIRGLRCRFWYKK